jgi:hypothetical protein
LSCRYNHVGVGGICYGGSKIDNMDIDDRYNLLKEICLDGKKMTELNLRGMLFYDFDPNVDFKDELIIV